MHMGIILKSLDDMASIAGRLRKEGKKVVTTNGVFDILHVGHASYLQWCKKQGDILFVGVNADASVRQYKGDKRPIIGEDDRAALIAALACVDYVYVFGGRTPEEWLLVVKPTFHVKAGDYTLDRSKETPKTRIYERDAVESVGGKCLLAPLVQGKSTTSIIEKIKEVYGSVPSKCAPRRPAVFLDRDGTIIQDKGYIHKIGDLEFIPGALDALKKLTRSDYRIIVITNQSGIARGKFSEDDYKRFNEEFLRRLSAEGIRIDGVYFCPHHHASSHQVYGKDCHCRKPKPGMVIAALLDHDIDLEKSIVVGDKTMDIQLGNSLGIRSVLVKTGNAGEDEEFDSKPDHVAISIKEAADWILSR